MKTKSLEFTATSKSELNEKVEAAHTLLGEDYRASLEIYVHPMVGNFIPIADGDVDAHTSSLEVSSVGYKYAHVFCDDQIERVKLDGPVKFTIKVIKEVKTGFFQ